MTRSTSNINQNGIFSSGIEAVKTLKTVFILEEQRSVKIESARGTEFYQPLRIEL